jgi:nicotinate-nucleotide pyrophosphorylase (carboxylating)
VSDPATAASLPDIEADARRVAAVALAEDGERDVTTELLEQPDVSVAGEFQYRGGGIVAGRVYAAAVAELAGCDRVEWVLEEGAMAAPGDSLGWVRGGLAAVLMAERPMLNLLQRACGIATATRALVTALGDLPCSVLHTRKTAPGLRGLDLQAVLAGGGVLHRRDLATQVMVKDNHWWALAGGGGELAAVLEAGRRRGITDLYVEVESLEQVKVACAAGATRLLVDNQSPHTLRLWGEAARASSPDIEIEATGGITLDNVRQYAEAGADFISVGALTHSVVAADLAIELSDATGG